MRENEYTIRVPELEAEPSWIGVIITAILQLWPITAILALKNLRTLHRNSKLKVYRRYALIIGDRAYVQISEIARATGIPTTKQGRKRKMEHLFFSLFFGRKKR